MQKVGKIFVSNLSNSNIFNCNFKLIFMRRILCFFFIIICAASCIPNKKLTYLQDQGFSTQYPKPIPNQRAPYRLQANDVLSIRIQGASQEITNTLNNSASPYTTYSSDPGNNFLNGYSIDEAGNIVLPTIGKVMVKNLTVEEAQTLIQKEVDEYYTNTTVVAKLVSFKVTVLGSVTRPGYFYIFSGQATVLDALGLAGDMTPFGNRNNVKLIRQTEKGSEVILLDMTKGEVMKSPYYYLVPNDVIYVEGLRAQTARNNIAPVGTVLTFLTSTLLLLTFTGIIKTK
jgi:polysaccharide biosynthesis/export protein